jgi:leucyl aminopeptidase (aminopeptidase T)
MLDIEKLLIDVFDPQADEIVTVMVDLPHGKVLDNEGWQARREMAERWRQTVKSLAAKRGFKVNPMLTYAATGANNAELPAEGQLGGKTVELEQAIKQSTLVIAMTSYSATAPLANLSEEVDDLRAASMPGVEQRMEGTALAADYSKVASRCRVIAGAMAGASLCEVIFSTGHRCWFDLRHRRPDVDDGFLPRTKKGEKVINLPSGETYEVPYEGEHRGDPSWTAGTIPVVEDGEMLLFHVAGNKILTVEGDGPTAERYRAFFAEDPARSNIAEVAFGVNDKAEVTGNVLEDEKAGFHWAFGRSDHLGGVVGVDAFRSSDNVVHQDIVYATGNPVQIERATVIHEDEDGRKVDVIADGKYRM